MRISDWSSDVCSSDLRARGNEPPTSSFTELEPDSAAQATAARHAGSTLKSCRGSRAAQYRRSPHSPFPIPHSRLSFHLNRRQKTRCHAYRAVPARGRRRGRRRSRSEEHTSELQSLMRISYAVYCLKKKKKQLKQTKTPHSKNTHTYRHLKIFKKNHTPNKGSRYISTRIP